MLLPIPRKCEGQPGVEKTGVRCAGYDEPGICRVHGGPVAQDTARHGTGTSDMPELVALPAFANLPFRLTCGIIRGSEQGRRWRFA